MLLLCRLLSTPDVAFQGVWHRSYPGEQPRCPTEKIFAVFLKNKLEFFLFFFLQLTLVDAPAFQRNRESDRRRRGSDKPVDGNSSLSLSSQARETRKTTLVEPT